MSTSLRDIKAGMSSRAREKVESRVAELRAQIDGLQPLRIALGQTQTFLAHRLKKSQASVAKLEQRTDMLLSTLREHIQGMGGELYLVASFPGHPEVRIGGIGDIPAPDRPEGARSTKVSRELELI